VDRRGVVDPEAVQAQLLGLYGEVLHAGVCGDYDACPHQNLQGVRIEIELAQTDRSRRRRILLADVALIPDDHGNDGRR
jgi:hypothetical protein